MKVSFTSSSYVSASEASATGGIMIYSSNQGKRKAFAVRLNNSEDYTAGTIELPVGVWDIAAIGWQSSIFSGAPYCAKKSVNLRPTVNGGVRYVALDLYTSRCDERLKSDYKNFFGEKSGSPALQLSLCNGLSTSGNVGCAAYASQRPTSIRVSLLSFTVSAKSNANGLDNLVVDNKKRPLSLCVATSGNTPIILSAEVSPGGSLVRIPIGTTPAQSPLRYMAIWGRI
ncbi:hypothetical protein ISS03_03490, partial [Patescibacteria group bacterium]|nr:hypothetical protein [Patescibacteria group bacterium]